MRISDWSSDVCSSDLLQIPQDFFREHVSRTGHEPGKETLAVGMVFLPRTDFGAQERCRVLVEREILNFGYRIYGWRQVPVHPEIVGEKANATRPEIEQVMIANARGEIGRAPRLNSSH